ncbi:MAG: hypothetical protein IPG22_06625 [Acidobacteria bacterium]|nr:hypothetical protein [Acidobacteriota bacterium]
MADVCDRADEQNEAAYAALLRMRQPEGPAATGNCLYCGEHLPQNANSQPRWCDADCFHEWEYEQAAKKRKGE